MAAAATNTALRAVATHCHIAAWSFSDVQAAEVFSIADGLRDLFLPPPAAASAVQQLPLLAVQQLPPQWLQLLPTELLTVVLSHLDTHDLARLAATCRPLWCDVPTPPPRPMPLLRPMGPVEMELRRRATARGLRIGSSLPAGALSWVPYLLKRVIRDALRRQSPVAVGHEVSLFLDLEGRLLTCGTENSEDLGELVLGHEWGGDIDPDEPRAIGPPTLVPSMLGKHIVSVATSGAHCLALSTEGEVYSWGDGTDGSLGHADGGARSVPSRIESLSRIESIAAGTSLTSAAVDEDGKLFTWGRATCRTDATMPSSLGYALDSHTPFQLTPKWVDALSQDCVVGVALGSGFTLAVTDAGAVLSFGYSDEGALGHGSLEAEVLPRRIEALAQTGRQFVAVAAGGDHALALTEEGELYGWGHECANGHGREERTPRRVTALIGQRVMLVNAGPDASCAVTEKGELFTWSCYGMCYNLGHGVDTPQDTPKRVEGLGGARIAAVAIGVNHTLAVDEDGAVWGFGNVMALGVVELTAGVAFVTTPTSIPTLRVRALKSP